MIEKYQNKPWKELRVATLNHILLNNFITPGSTVIDATAGNGHDSVFLLEKINPGGTLFAFDIQSEALKTTQNKIDNMKQLHHTTNYHLIADSHGNLDQYLNRSVQVAFFNLGYLPGGDHSVTTNWNELYKALQILTKRLISSGGFISIVSYGGHPAGQEEQNRLYQFIQGLPPSEFSIHVTKVWNTIRPAPVSFIIQRI